MNYHRNNIPTNNTVTNNVSGDWYDWYVDPQIFFNQLKPYLKSIDAEILIPGCGISALPRLLNENGFKNVTCIDSSQDAIQTQQSNHINDEAFDFAVMDATNLNDIPNYSLDLIADKALLDTLYANGPGGLRLAQRYLFECARILRPGGVLIIMSHSILNRQEDIKAAGFNITSMKQIPKPDVGIEFGSSDQFHIFSCINQTTTSVNNNKRRNNSITTAAAAADNNNNQQQKQEENEDDIL
jgi:SAM-dependent methyltransferase